MICHFLSESYHTISKIFKKHVREAILTLSTHRTLALTGVRGDPVADAMLQKISGGL